ncbi:MAG: Crp/Fnr family transcriptional regulator [Betaproteobacteria bacterium]|nr:Crp/Fnr family transcriptional regulator [Betaproteobacteria bacterium]
MSETQALAARLGAAGLFAGLKPELIGALAREAIARRFASGERIWRSGDAATHFVSVEEGLVEVEQATPQGEGILVGLFGPGDTLCVVPALRARPYPADAVALTKTVSALLVPGRAVFDALETHPQLERALNRALVEHAELLHAKIGIVSAGPVPRRLAALFAYLGKRFGRREANGALRLDLELTRERIGQLVGARTETVIRVLSRWQKAGWLRSGAAGFEVLQPEMLDRVAER